MFRNVPACSGMFHVPGFIDGQFFFCPDSNFKISNRVCCHDICLVFFRSWTYILQISAHVFYCIRCILQVSTYVLRFQHVFTIRIILSATERHTRRSTVTGYVKNDLIGHTLIICKFLLRIDTIRLILRKDTIRLLVCNGVPFRKPQKACYMFNLFKYPWRTQDDSLLAHILLRLFKGTRSKKPATWTISVPRVSGKNSCP